MLILAQNSGAFFGFSSSQIQAVAAIISAIFSALIYLVYREQVKLKKLEQRPIIAAKEYKTHDTDSIAVRLKNYGQGSATQIQVRTIVAPIDTRVTDTLRDRVIIWVKNLFPRSGSSYPVIRPITDNEGESNGDDSSTWEHPYGARIAPSESGVYQIELSLKTNPNLWPDWVSRRWQNLRPWLPGTNNDRNPHIKTFGAAFEDLRRNASDYRLRVVVRPTTEFGKEKQETVFDYVIPAEDELTLKKALENGMAYERFRNNRRLYDARTDDATPQR